MNKPDDVNGVGPTLRWMAGQGWKDLKSIYYANTPVWRWLKSGALVFLGLCVWAGASVLLSVRPEWTFLYLFLAYGFLLVLWGPLTHAVIVPLVIRLRRTATHPVLRRVVNHAAKINLTVFFAIVVVLAIVQPGIMMVEFSPPSGDPSAEVRATVECADPVDGLIVCELTSASGFDHAVAIADGEVVDRADEPPYRLEIAVEEVDRATFRIQLRDAEGNPLRTFVQSVPED